MILLNYKNYNDLSVDPVMAWRRKYNQAGERCVAYIKYTLDYIKYPATGMMSIAGPAQEYTPPQEMRNSALPHLATDQLSQNVITINSRKFRDTAKKAVIGTAILRRVTFTLLHDTFRLLPINGHNIVAYLLKARSVEPKKQPVLGNGCVTCNNGVTVGSGVSCAVSAEAI
jgi:hypothetical protein